MPDRKTLRTSRVMNQTDDVHLCIMCLRAIMNYQVRGLTYPACCAWFGVSFVLHVVCSCQTGFDLVMKHPRCVNEITLSLNNRNPR